MYPSHFFVKLFEYFNCKYCTDYTPIQNTTETNLCYKNLNEDNEHTHSRLRLNRKISVISHFILYFFINGEYGSAYLL